MSVLYEALVIMLIVLIAMVAGLVITVMWCLTSNAFGGGK